MSEVTVGSRVIVTKPGFSEGEPGEVKSINEEGYAEILLDRDENGNIRFHLSNLKPED